MFEKMPTSAKIEAAYNQYATNIDGSLAEHDVVCAIRYLTGSRMSPGLRSKVISIIENKGGVNRSEFREILEEVVDKESETQLEDLWEELTGDPNGSIKKHTLLEWVYSSMGVTPKSSDLAQLLWDSLDKQDIGVVGIKEVRELLQE